MSKIGIFAIGAVCVLWTMLAVLSVSAQAEIITLKNGSTLTGRITHQDENMTFLELSIGGEMTLDNDDIVSISDTEGNLNVVFTPMQRKTEPAVSTPAPDAIVVIRDTPTPTLTPLPTPTPTPLKLRPIKFRRVDKQEHRTLLARRYVYHIVVEEPIEDWETRLLLAKLMKLCLQDAKYADAIEIRLYGLDERGKTFDWPFATGVYAPEGDWEKADASIPRSQFLLKVVIQGEAEFYRM